MEKQELTDRIFNEDCLLGMKRIPDGSIDAIICDLPYGTTRNKWDSLIPLDEIWTQYKRIIKDNGAIILFAQSPFDKILGCSNLSMLKYEWIWIKENGTGFLNSKKAPLKIHENILVFYEKQCTYNPQMRKGFNPYRVQRGRLSTNYGYANSTISKSDGERYPIDVLEYMKDKDKLHPTQKPVALIEYLVCTYTNEGEIILDNCMGSGTTAIACIRANRHFVGFEKDTNYYKKAVERIKAEQMQLRLF